MAPAWALLVALACDASPPSPSANRQHVEEPQPRSAADDRAAPTVEAAPIPSDPESDARRILVDGRLGPGSELVALTTLAAADAPPTCATCSLPGAVKLVVLAAIDDDASDEHLRDLDALVRFYADDGLAGVVVLAPRDGERLVAPFDPRAAIDRALALARRLRLALPVHVPARVDDGEKRVLEQYYDVREPPLVLLVGPDDRVLVSMTAQTDGTARPADAIATSADWAPLDRAIVDALATASRELAKSPVR